MSDLHIIEDGAVVVSEGVITHVGPTKEIVRQVDPDEYLEIDASGRALLPGLWIVIPILFSVVIVKKSFPGG